MEIEDVTTGLGSEEQSYTVSHPETYEEPKKDWSLSEHTGKEEKGDSYCDDGMDAELDYDEENRYSDRASSPGDEDRESYQNGEPCMVSDDDDDFDGGENHISKGARSESRESGEQRRTEGYEVGASETANSISSDKKEPSEDGEIDDLEEGELRSDSDSGAEQGEVSEKEVSAKFKESGKVPTRIHDDVDSEVPNVCKFYLRGNCTWGLDCKYIHPHEANRERVLSNSRTKDVEWTGDREHDTERPSIHSRVTYPSSSTDKADLNGGRGAVGESAWERGLREARELMKKATKKKEEPDFEKKRLVLAPSEELDRRITDDDSDDSRAIPKGVRGDLSPHRVVRSVVPGNEPYCDTRSRIVRRYDRFDEQNPNDISSGVRNCYRYDRYAEEYGRAGGYGPVNRSRIPSLMDSIRENRMVEIKKDLGPQVLYPNGRPGSRRRDNNVRRTNKRDMPINERYYVPRRVSRSPRSVSRSPVRSQSLSSRRSVLPVSRSGSEKSGPTKKVHSLGTSITFSGGRTEIRDPWDRSQRKRNRSHELPPTTLGAVLQKARLSEERSHSRKRMHSASVSESSVTESSSSTSSRSTSSDCRRKAATRASLASAIPLKSLFDDDGSIRQTDLSSFRIPKKKRPSRSPSRPNAVLKKSGSKTYIPRNDSTSINELQASHPKWQVSMSPTRCLQPLQKGAKPLKVPNIVRNERKISEAKEKISSDESLSSSSSGSSSDEDTEPAAYRRKRKSQADDDGLPTEGIPLSPEAEAEDVSSEEDERSASPKETGSRSQSGSRSTSERHTTPSTRVEDDPKEDSSGEHREEDPEKVRCSQGADIINDEVEKEERRAELLRQLKCVEEAIARKRNRPIA